MTDKDKQPNPGSNGAVSKGCKCPIIDNHYGAGIFIDSNGLPLFVINADCPLHGYKDNNDETQRIYQDQL